MNIIDIISKKRDKKELDKAEIDYFINKYVSGEIPDYQAAALLMAIRLNGLSVRETVDLTKAMRDSGAKADLSDFGGNVVDKHSTGGVGDKTSLIVAPIVASLGCVVAKMSGKGLGHTGGTVDKLNSIKGFNSSLSPDEFKNIAKKCGISIICQTDNFAPADKKLYALRDVTATVDNIGLIASSIMSKKLATGADTIVLDVKYGNGAFMKTVEDAETLADLMVKIGKECGKKICAVITNMNSPLGNNIGNALEINEVISVLKNGGPKDLRDICLCLSSNIVSLSKGVSYEEAYSMCEEVLTNNNAYNKFLEWVNVQGGDISVLSKHKDFWTPKYKYAIRTPKVGYVESIKAKVLGEASVCLGAGRAKKDDEIDYSAGIIIKKNVGDFVRRGDIIAYLYSSTKKDFSLEKKKVLSGFVFSDTFHEKQPLIVKTIK